MINFNVCWVWMLKLAFIRPHFFSSRKSMSMRADVFRASLKPKDLNDDVDFAPGDFSANFFGVCVLGGDFFILLLLAAPSWKSYARTAKLSDDADSTFNGTETRECVHETILFWLTMLMNSLFNFWELTCWLPPTWIFYHRFKVLWFKFGLMSTWISVQTCNSYVLHKWFAELLNIFFCADMAKYYLWQRPCSFLGSFPDHNFFEVLVFRMSWMRHRPCQRSPFLRTNTLTAWLWPSTSCFLWVRRVCQSICFKS